MRVLVTGGAGYIGSITAQFLCEQNHQVFILDNLSTGFLENIPPKAQFIKGDILDREFVHDLLVKNQIEGVLHFAAKLIVPESILKPFEYYKNNFYGSLNLLESCRESKVKYFIFSSTAAVYGNPDTDMVTEDTPLNPMNPYGASKAMVEQALKDYDRTFGLKYVALRYFNVAGAMADLSLGQRSKNATHLIKVASELALGKRQQMSIYGTDYSTFDGTGVRDYIHVVDLAMAHLAALQYLQLGSNSEILNCGYGRGYSVRQVIDKIKALSGNNFKVIEGPRRAGDPASVIADPSRARRILNWKSTFDDLELICKSSLDWEKTLS